MDTDGQTLSKLADFFEREHSGGRLRTVTSVVEEHHADNFDAMAALFELRQNHLAELVAGGMPAGAEYICDFHDGGSFLDSRRAQGREAITTSLPQETIAARDYTGGGSVRAM